MVPLAKLLIFMIFNLFLPNLHGTSHCGVVIQGQQLKICWLKPKNIFLFKKFISFNNLMLMFIFFCLRNFPVSILWSTIHWSRPAVLNTIKYVSWKIGIDIYIQSILCNYFLNELHWNPLIIIWLFKTYIQSLI